MKINENISLSIIDCQSLFAIVSFVETESEYGNSES